MNKELKSYKVTILGNQYTLVSDESQAAVLETAAALDALMQDLAGKYTLQNTQTIAVLAALKVLCTSRTLQASLDEANAGHAGLIRHIEQSLRLLSEIV